MGASDGDEDGADDGTAGAEENARELPDGATGAADDGELGAELAGEAEPPPLLNRRTEGSVYVFGRMGTVAEPNVRHTRKNISRKATLPIGWTYQGASPTGVSAM